MEQKYGDRECGTARSLQATKLTRGVLEACLREAPGGKPPSVRAFCFAEATWEAGAVPEQNLEHYVY